LTYKLLALDLDGTVMGDDLRISPGVRYAISAARDAGVAVTLATGRSYDSAIRWARELQIDVPLVCYQGGQVKDPVDETVLYEANFPRDLALELIAWAKERESRPYEDWSEDSAGARPEDEFGFRPGRIGVAMFVDGVMYLEEIRQDAEFYESYFGQRVELVPDLADSLLSDPSKAMFISHEETSDEILPELKRAFEGRMQIVRSHPYFVEATPEHVDKGKGLALVATRLGIAREDVIAVGDNENDLAMVQWAGLGVAMGNASNAVKKAAAWIAPSVADDGIVAIVDRFILKQGAANEKRRGISIRG